jgi:(p)ppGpp synthase/HD superfamily hydrolase
MTTARYPCFYAALAYAAAKHDGQVRKGTNIPYITHPVAVAEILSRYNCAPEVVYADQLHDVIEGSHVTQEDLAEQFDAEVAAVSEKKWEANKKIPWEARKLRQLRILQESDAADALHNLTTIVADFARAGDKLWQRFNASKAKQLWYYITLTNILVDKLGAGPPAGELQAVLAEFLDVCAFNGADCAAADNEARTAAADQV